jgi:hypothetical protein
VATPIAASLGDLTTLALLSWIASLLFEAISMLVSHTLFHYNRILIIEMKKICTELIFKLGFLEFRVFWGVSADGVLSWRILLSAY